MKFYTNISSTNQKIVHIGYRDGKKFIERLNFKPTMGLETDKESKWKSLHGEKNLEEKSFKNPGEYRKYFRDYNSIMSLHSTISPEQQFIAKKYGEKTEFDFDKVRIFKIDIEVDSDGHGFPLPDEVKWPITSIAIKDSYGDKYYVLALKGYDPKKTELDLNPNKIHFKYCESEVELLVRFIKLMRDLRPDIMVGWYSNGFDYPYLINRSFALLKKEEVLKMSPTNRVSVREGFKEGKKVFYCNIGGVTLLDYIEMYKKYTFTPREMYSLDFIAEEELGENKIDYSEYDNLTDLWNNNPQKYIDYNIYDVELIDKIDIELGLMQLHCTVAYDVGCNIGDAMSPVKLWDASFYYDLTKEGIMVPPIHVKDSEEIPGAYVMAPRKGKYGWFFSVDLNSLYPHLMQQFNISPECLIDGMRLNVLQRNADGKIVINDGFLDQTIKNDTNFIMAGNGCFFRRDKEGFTSKSTKKIYGERKIAKTEMLRLEQLREDENTTKYNSEIKRLGAIEKSKKIRMNAMYGAMANRYFRYMDERLASAITLSGQLAIRWIGDTLMSHPAQKKYGYEIIYTDTDSCYFSVEKLVKSMLKKKPNLTDNQITDQIDRFVKKIINPIIEEGYENLREYVNAVENRMFMAREVIASSGIWQGKKKYAMMVHDSEGVRYPEPKMKVKGLELVKSSTPAVIRGKLKEAVFLLLNDENKLINFLSDMKKEFQTYKPELIAFPRGVGTLNKYTPKVRATEYGLFGTEIEQPIYLKGSPIAVRGALLYNDYIKKQNLLGNFPEIREGDKVKFIYLKLPNPIKEDVISFLRNIPNRDKFMKYFDYSTQYYKVFVKPVQALCDSVNIDVLSVDKVDLTKVF